jgi:hypothetical protein
MKRELGADLQQTFFPSFEAEVRAFIDEIAARIGGIYDDVAALIERERGVARAETLEPIERALRAGETGQRGAARNELERAGARLATVEAMLGESERHGRAEASQTLGAANVLPTRDAVRSEAASRQHAPELTALAFDAGAYDRGLRPERYRVVVLGALRRGKSSLINAIAGTRLLADEGGAEAHFPVHVRYGPAERAYALDRDGVWQEIPARDAMAQAARSPVLIETPWSLPRELVLVHAPAFDSGNDFAEEIALAAARAASEVVGLFSRQLSDRELALYGRVAEFEKPMLLAHTIADNETARERRTVVDLAARYVRERGIPVGRIFTISALDFLAAAHERRAAAGWNELEALRDTLRAHAEEHMRRQELRRRSALGDPGPPVPGRRARSAAPAGSEPGAGLRSTIARLLGRSRET